jgi:hypothetical protein
MRSLHTSHLVLEEVSTYEPSSPRGGLYIRAHTIPLSFTIYRSGGGGQEEAGGVEEARAERSC